MVLKTGFSAALVAVASIGFGSASNAAILWTFDGTVVDAGLYCAFPDPDEECQPDEMPIFNYALGETGVATARIRAGVVTLNFNGSELFSGEVERIGNRYSSWIDRNPFAVHLLEWNDRSGFLYYENDDVP